MNRVGGKMLEVGRGRWEEEEEEEGGGGGGED